MESRSSPPIPRFRLDRDGYQLLDGNSPVRVEKQPMELLFLLVERKGRLVTRDEIANTLWSDGVFVDTDRNINSIVRKLRQALDDDPDHPQYIETVVGKGYRFVGPLEITPSPSEGEPKTAEVPAAAEVPANATLSRLTRRVMLALVVLVAGAATTWLVARKLLSSRTEAPIRSLAVLPLANVSGDATQDYFADGMTQELTAEMAQLGDVRVISHTSVLQYRDSRKSAPEIARDLNVDALIEGSVLRSGDRVRVTAELIRAPADRSLWANSYERDLRDVLSLQRDIAGDIAQQVKIKLTRRSSDSAAAKPIDPEGHDAYLRGLYEYEKNTEDGLRQAIVDFQHAIARQPNYAAAYAAMADTYLELGVLYWPPPQAMPQAKAAALKALELDPQLSAAHESLGSVYYFYEWDWPAAQREAGVALALNPNNAYAHDLLAAYYGTVGRCDDNLHELQAARELAPRSGEILGDTVMWPFMCRNYDLAIANGDAIIAVQPDNAWAEVFLGMAYAKQKRTSEAMQHADMAVQSDPSPLIASFRANVYALAGRTTEAAAMLRQIEKQRVEHYSCAYEVGTGYFLLGHTDTGFRWLDNAYQGRSECMILLKVDPRLDSVRSDPRYQALLKRVGLAN
ncbi:MAG TPA: winged helix-turn-helix domain-containing protein [Terriglobales bacterium]|nr:winged helix-turn-helix domain-containing protein [Terriglobales bacterium]